MLRVERQYVCEGTMYRLDGGYSEWLGDLLRRINTAQLQLLKLNYQVRHNYLQSVYSCNLHL